MRSGRVRLNDQVIAVLNNQKAGKVFDEGFKFTGPFLETELLRKRIIDDAGV